MKVLYATSEAYPVAMSGGLADVAGALPKALRKRLVGCRIVLPLYEDVSDEIRANMRFIKSITVPVSWRRQYCGIFEAKIGSVIYYLLDNQYYFKRKGLYGHYDDAERFAFFSRAVLEMIPHISFKPDIIHAHDVRASIIASTFANKVRIISHIHCNFKNTKFVFLKSFLFLLASKKIEKIY